MILYHGTNEDISEIDFSKSRLEKDFGVGGGTLHQIEMSLDVRRKESLYSRAVVMLMCMNTNGMNVQIESCEYCGLMGIL